MPAELDLLVKGGRVVDGTGNPWFRADVGISAGRILEISRVIKRDSRRTIQAGDRIVAPGFVDTHTHSDLTLLVNGRAESMIRQGVTTAIVGLCGLSAAPIKEEHLDDWKAVLSAIVAHYAISVDHVSWKWTSIAEYLAEVEKGGVSQNVGTFVGHSAIRTAVMGLAAREPSSAELGEMCGLVDQSMRDGAFGLSSGLDFAPGKDAEEQELTELCRRVSRYGGLYCAHQRNGAAEVVQATEESIRIAETSGTRLIVSHLVPKLGGWGKGPELIRLIEDRRAKGLDVVFDDYFEVGAPPSVSTLFPSWVFQGGPKAMLERLKDRGVRERVKQEFTGPLSTVVRTGRWDLISLTSARKHKDLVGKNILEIARLRNTEPWEVVFDIFVEEEASAEFVTFFRSAEDAKLMIAHPYAIVETDTCCSAPYGPLSEVHDFKSYNLVAKILRTYGREQKVVHLEELVRKLTSLPAMTFGLKERGVIREGCWADLVIFDPERVGEGGTFSDPIHYPKGIDHAIVNGVSVVENGEHNGELPGKVLRAMDSLHWKQP